jgi:predicted methyltransferase
MVGIAVGCLTSSIAIAQTRVEEEKRREEWQRVSDIFRVMDVRPGGTVADIGAGDGFFTIRLADVVGPAGRVFAVDIRDEALERLRRRLREEPRANVTVVKGLTTDPRLPAASLDAALIVNAYHEMSEHQAMLSAIRTALKPTGRLVIVDPITDARRAAARGALVPQHELTPEFALQDARAAGLRIIGLVDPFTMRGRTVEWMMTLTPGDSPPPVTMAPAAVATEPSKDDWRDARLRVSIDEFITLAKSGATIIDVRDEGMFSKGHIPDAILIPLDSIEEAAERLKGLGRPLVTYCS